MIPIIGIVLGRLESAPILKCRENRQKTVLPLPIRLTMMDINHKTFVRPSGRTTKSKGMNCDSR
ncbi:hypothetical protein RCH21_003275 [Arthrobacter sp. PL16]|nr:hypothetical protein [Arthrobacter sp. PL16]